MHRDAKEFLEGEVWRGPSDMRGERPSQLTPGTISTAWLRTTLSSRTFC